MKRLISTSLIRSNHPSPPIYPIFISPSTLSNNILNYPHFHLISKPRFLYSTEEFSIQKKNKFKAIGSLINDISTSTPKSIDFLSDSHSFKNTKSTDSTSFKTTQSIDHKSIQNSVNSSYSQWHNNPINDISSEINLSMIPTFHLIFHPSSLDHHPDSNHKLDFDLLGQVSLDSNHWTDLDQDCLVTFRYPDPVEDTESHLSPLNIFDQILDETHIIRKPKRFGLVRKPLGRRRWLVAEWPNGELFKVNFYDITSQWCFSLKNKDGLDADTLTQLKTIAINQFIKEMQVIWINIGKNPFDLWKKLISDDSKFMKIDKTGPSNIWRGDEDDMVEKEAVGGVEMKKIANHRPFLSLEKVSRFLFDFPDNTTTSCIFSTSSSITSISSSNDGNVEPKIEQDVKINPIHCLASQMFLDRHATFFAINVHRGFYCHDPDWVFYKLRQSKLNEKEIQARNRFVKKISILLKKEGEPNKSTTLPTLPSILQPSKIHNIDPNKIHNVENELEMDVELDSSQWTQYECQLLGKLKHYALSSGEVEDGEVNRYLLKPLGFLNKPHHAFQLLVQLGIWSSFENPHLLRWEGKLSYSQAQIESSRNLISKHGYPYPTVIMDQNPIQDSNPIQPIQTQDPNPFILSDRDAAIRVDLSNHPAFAVDGEDAEEIDDAISIVTDSQNRDWIYIHIADVHSVIDPHSLWDIEACHRSSSIYLPDRSYPMFPSPINEWISLGKKEKRKDQFENNALEGDFNRFKPCIEKQRALSFGALLNESGHIEEWRVVNSYIGLVERVTFDQLDIILQSMNASSNAISDGREKSKSWLNQTKHHLASSQLKEDDHNDQSHTKKPRIDQLKSEYTQNFVKLLKVATKRRAIRLDNRAVLASKPTPKVKVNIDSTGDAQVSIGLASDWSRSSQGLIMELMLLCGEIAATFGKENNLSLLFKSRSVSPSSRIKLTLSETAFHANLLARNPEAMGARLMRQISMLGSLGLDEFKAKPTRHEGYGLSCFVQVTSPLRRYNDLLNHYQIKAALRGTTLPFHSEEIIEIATASNQRENDIKALVGSSKRFWILGYLEKRTQIDPKKLFRALVTSTKEHDRDEYKVMILDFGLEEKLVSKKMLHRGEVIWVYIDLINPFYDTLVLKNVKKK